MMSSSNVSLSTGSVQNQAATVDACLGNCECSQDRRC